VRRFDPCRRHSGSAVESEATGDCKRNVHLASGRPLPRGPCRLVWPGTMTVPPAAVSGSHARAEPRPYPSTPRLVEPRRLLWRCRPRSSPHPPPSMAEVSTRPLPSARPAPELAGRRVGRGLPGHGEDGPLLRGRVGTLVAAWSRSVRWALPRACCRSIVLEFVERILTSSVRCGCRRRFPLVMTASAVSGDGWHARSSGARSSAVRSRSKSGERRSEARAHAAPLPSRDCASDRFRSPFRRDRSLAEVVPTQRVHSGDPRRAPADGPLPACHSVGADDCLYGIGEARRAHAGRRGQSRVACRPRWPR